LFDSDLCSRPSSLGGIFESAHQATLASEAALLGEAVFTHTPFICELVTIAEITSFLLTSDFSLQC